VTLIVGRFETIKSSMRTQTNPRRKDLQKIALIAGTALMIAFSTPTAWAAAIGRAAIQKYWDAGIKAGVKNLALTPGKIDQFGEVAREIGNYSLETKDGTKLEGKWVGIWKPQDGSWKLDTDVWNSDK
jgi:ketosteroid isomerase-like protein